MPSQPPSIAAPPESPTRSEPATFAAKADAWVAWLAAEAVDVGACALAAYDNANEAAAALVSAVAAASGVTAALWVSGTTYAIGDVRRSPANGRPYRRLTAGAGTTDPASDATNWTEAAVCTPDLIISTSAAVVARAGAHYLLANVATTTVTLPGSPSPGDVVWITPANGLADNVVARNGENIMGIAEDMTIGSQYRTCQLRYVNSTLGWLL